MHIENLMTMNIPRTAECLVQDLLCPEQVSVMFGPPNTGKTFIALELARCISTGQPFLGLDTKQADVFLVELEGRHGIAKRSKAIQKFFPVAQGDHQVLIGFDQFNLQVESLDRHLKELLEKCNVHPRLLIIDTLSMAMNGADENSSAMTSAVMTLKGIAKTCGTHVMVIHHSGKDPSKGARGHSSLKGAVDTEILIHDNKLSVTKQRDLPKISPIPFRLEVVDLELPKGFQPMSSCVVLPANAEVRLTDQQLLLNILKTFSATDDLIDLESVKREWTDNKPDIQPESALRGFNRARDGLVKQGLLKIEGNHCVLLNPESANDDDFSGTDLTEQSDRHPPL